MKTQTNRSITWACGFVVWTSLLAPALADSSAEADLVTNPYQIGIAPSHIANDINPMLDNHAAWDELKAATDYFKVYDLQNNGPDTESKLNLQKLAHFTHKNNIKIILSFSDFLLTS